jgi:polar amino acid transport system substrate-binding protein
MDSTLIKLIAPTGVLRASINLGNPLLAKRDGPSGQAAGVSVDLARELAAQLKLDIELLVFDKAAESVQAVETNQADIGFFAIDPLRGQHIAFSAAYVLIEGCYMVRADSPLTDNAQVDQPGTRVTVGKGSAYDLFLTRHLAHAQIERAASSQAVIQTFIEQGHEVAAGVKQQLLADAIPHPGLRLLPGRFMVIKQAMGLPKSRGAEAAQALGLFVQRMKTSGFVADALKRHGVEGAEVAP